MRSKPKDPAASGPGGSALGRVVALGAAVCAAMVAGLSLSPAAGADSCANAEFRQGAAGLLPDCRAYERVSPLGKNGFDVQALALANRAYKGAPASFDGNAASFVSPGAFADAEYGGAGLQIYLSRRGASDWDTTALLPYIAPAFRSIQVPAFSSTMDSYLASTIDASVLGVPEEGNDNLYLRQAASRQTQLLAGSASELQAQTASEDISHVATSTTEVLTDEPVDESARKVYESADGVLRLVSIDPEGVPFDRAVLGEGTAGSSTTLGAVSSDGEHIFITAGAGNSSEIYRRSGGQVTVHASPTDLDPPDPDGPAAKVFRMASRDGSRVLFTTSERLTSDANDPGGEGDLYRYDIDADELRNLTASTPGDAPADVRGVVGIDGAADRVYYVARQVVSAGPSPLGQAPQPGEANLYLWEEDGSPQGHTRFITTLDQAGVSFSEPLESFVWQWQGEKPAQASRDASVLVFSSYAEIGPHGPAGTPRIYRYDATAGELDCVSCRTDGSGSGSARLPLLDNGFEQGHREMYPRFVSADGERVFFSTAEKLVERDTNGRFDAYMWQDGQVHLLSTGRYPDDSYFHAADENGNNAFFRTRQQLVAADVDRLADLYVARVGGGLTGQQETAWPECEGDSCQGSDADVAAFDRPASVAAAGRGNPRFQPSARDCGRTVRVARRALARSRTVNRAARRAAGSRSARRLNRRAVRAKRAAKQRVARAKRCRRANRRAVR